MSEIKDQLIYALPIVISVVILVFLYFRRKNQIELETISRSIRIKDIGDEKDDRVEKLVLKGDVDLRVLEEVKLYDPRPFYISRPGRSKREYVLGRIQTLLRKALSKSVDSENFTEIKDRIIKLLDQIANELSDIRQKIPFEGLDDPERSLLIDLVAEIDRDKLIPRQKAEQLAEIIKVKHQDIKKLQLENAKSVGWTRWGTIGTVSFGLLSLVLSIYTIYT